MDAGGQGSGRHLQRASLGENRLPTTPVEEVTTPRSVRNGACAGTRARRQWCVCKRASPAGARACLADAVVDSELLRAGLLLTEHEGLLVPRQQLRDDHLRQPLLHHEVRPDVPQPRLRAARRGCISTAARGIREERGRWEARDQGEVPGGLRRSRRGSARGARRTCGGRTVGVLASGQRRAGSGGGTGAQWRRQCSCVDRVGARARGGGRTCEGPKVRGSKQYTGTTCRTARRMRLLRQPG